jgi:hypothetical protein
MSPDDSATHSIRSCLLTFIGFTVPARFLLNPKKPYASGRAAGEEAGR